MVRIIIGKNLNNNDKKIANMKDVLLIIYLKYLHSDTNVVNQFLLFSKPGLNIKGHFSSIDNFVYKQGYTLS